MRHQDLSEQRPPEAIAREWVASIRTKKGINVRNPCVAAKLCRYDRGSVLQIRTSEDNGGGASLSSCRMGCRVEVANNSVSILKSKVCTGATISAARDQNCRGWVALRT